MLQLLINLILYFNYKIQKKKKKKKIVSNFLLDLLKQMHGIKLNISLDISFMKQDKKKIKILFLKLKQKQLLMNLILKMLLIIKIMNFLTGLVNGYQKAVDKLLKLLININKILFNIRH